MCGKVMAMKRKVLKIVLLLLLFAVLYVVVGALAPFVLQRSVSEEYKEGVDTSRFRKEGQSRDYASVVETNADALSVRIRMIEEATESIVLSTFDIRPGKSASDVFAALYAAADRGVEVKVLVDGLYGSYHMNGEPIFEAAGSHENIEIKFYNIPSLLKPWTINGRMHDKYILIDDKLLLMGGRNTFNYFLGDYAKKGISYDREVLVCNAVKADGDADSVVCQVWDYFEKMWALDTCETVFDGKGEKEEVRKAGRELTAHYDEMRESHPDWFAPIDYEKEMIPIKNAVLLSNTTGIYAKEPRIWYELAELMKKAKERVYIQMPYAVLSRGMYADLSDIAERTDCTLLINSTAVGDNFMASSDYTHNRRKVLDTGVDLYEFNGDHSFHGKSLLIDDDLSVIGSCNTDMRSVYVDTETMLVIYGEEFSEELEGHIRKMEDRSLKVNEDGTYERKDTVAPKELTGKEKAVFAVTSRLFQIFRYLI